MRLSKLHITGFKSFPDRAELAFDHGVTAIVGPNGCGKSNVVDAITWVLGEQSAKSLRGERMEDVIFNGSDARKPTPAAEVRLKLTEVAQAAMRQMANDASPADPLLDEQPIITRDIEIGRRLYRSGESEYLIDGEVCRLRDVHDVLMDSGLGIKAYAVIEQGKIGQILSSRPTERRALIEEAAGVTKYKSRRRAAELKLDAARLNLTRVDDIVFEVEKQRGALKRQAAKARRYKRLREELRRWEQVQFAHRYESLAREIETAQARFDDARAREVAAAAHVAEHEAALETLRLELAEAEAASGATREQAHARELEIGRRQQQIEFDKQQIAELAERRQAFEDEARDLEARVDPARVAIDSQRSAAQHAGAALESAAHRVDEAQRTHELALMGVQGVEAEADELRAAVMSAATTLSALRQARENAVAVRDRVASERGRLDVEARDLELAVARARASRDSAIGELAAARTSLETIERTRLTIDADLTEKRSKREQLRHGHAALQRELAGVSGRLKSLEELEAQRATFGDAAKALLAGAPDHVGQHGAVADHVDVERTFERAVDALLGDIVQHVIVDRVSDVQSAMDWLRRKDAGRCGFLVLETAVPDAPSSALVAPAGSRTLRSVVRAHGPHAAAIERVIGDALIAESFDDARELARHVDVPVAAMTGEVWRGSWLVQGGARETTRGILETRGEIKELRDRLTAGEASAHSMGNEVMSLELDVLNLEDALAADVESHHRQEKTIIGAELAGRARRRGRHPPRRTSRRRHDRVGSYGGRSGDGDAARRRRVGRDSHA